MPKSESAEQEPMQVDLPDGWSAKIPYTTASQVIIPIRLSAVSRFDVQKQVFIDLPFCGPGTPPYDVMHALKMKIAESRMTEAERMQFRSTMLILQLERENKELQRENESLRADLRLLQPKPSLIPDECVGGCSRGGDGPSCGKRGCRG